MTSQSLVYTLHVDNGCFDQRVIDLTMPQINMYTYTHTTKTPKLGCTKEEKEAIEMQHGVPSLSVSIYAIM